VPTYDFECQNCHHRFEVTQSFSAPAPTECPECKGPVKKVFAAVGIVFKGSGFYKTDSRPSSGSSGSSGD
jgi:putative FmdB family regulatory protein